MSLNLDDIKGLLASDGSRALRNNRFSVDMNLWNPAQGSYVSVTDYPALSVSTPTTEIQGLPFEFQNIAIQVPIKRQNTNLLQITFYANESLAIYSTLVSLIKTYGGESYNFNSNINQPSVYTANNMYNIAIRDNTIFVRLKTANSDVVSEGEDVNYIGYSEVYPRAIIPIDFNSQAQNNLAAFTVMFEYARTTTRYLGEI